MRKQSFMHQADTQSMKMSNNVWWPLETGLPPTLPMRCPSSSGQPWKRRRCLDATDTARVASLRLCRRRPPRRPSRGLRRHRLGTTPPGRCCAIPQGSSCPSSLARHLRPAGPPGSARTAGRRDPRPRSSRTERDPRPRAWPQSRPSPAWRQLNASAPSPQSQCPYHEDAAQAPPCLAARRRRRSCSRAGMFAARPPHPAHRCLGGRLCRSE
mmetsp:Transcript_59478/g.128644  ORF Transcript_59478/g.128644 Transcript_59478/m.128644 type:complete len:212 (-) Transcript_59478:1510-2145(-)